MSESDAPFPSERTQELDLWPDGRYRVFCLVVSLIMALTAGLIFTALEMNDILWVVGPLFVATFAILDPTVPPNVKTGIEKLMFGSGPSDIGKLTQNAYKWTYQKHRLIIFNQEGDAAAHRVYRLKNKENDSFIRSNLHGAGFNQGEIKRQEGE